MVWGVLSNAQRLCAARQAIDCSWCYKPAATGNRISVNHLSRLVFQSLDESVAPWRSRKLLTAIEQHQQTFGMNIGAIIVIDLREAVTQGKAIPAAVKPGIFYGVKKMTHG